MADKALAWLQQASGLLARQAVPDVLGARARPTARTTSSRSGRTSTKASSTTAGTSYASASSSGRRNSAGFPPNAKLTPRAETMAAWDSIPESERPFQRRLMEVFAGFVEHTDAQVGKLDRRTRAARRPRQHDHLLHLGRQRLERRRPEGHASASCWPRTTSRTRSSSSWRRSTRLGGLDALGGPKVDNMYHAGWAWAGSTPFRSTKLVAAHFGGTRNPMVDLLAEGHQAGQDAAAAVPPRQRHRADALRSPRHQAAEGGRRLRAGPDRRREHGLHVRRRQGAGPQARPSTSRTTAAAASITTAGSPAPSGRSSRGIRRLSRAARRTGTRTRTSGSFTTCARTSRRPTTSPRRSPNGWPR